VTVVKALSNMSLEAEAERKSSKRAYRLRWWGVSPTAATQLSIRPTRPVYEKVSKRMGDKRERTYTVQDLLEGVVLEPFKGNHAETHEASLSDVGISIGAEGGTIPEWSLARRGWEARANRLNRRGRRCLSGRFLRSGTEIEELHGTTLDRSAEGIRGRGTVTLGGRVILSSRETFGGREALARGKDWTERVHANVLLLDKQSQRWSK
jgi:hypothetical protein